MTTMCTTGQYLELQAGHLLLCVDRASGGIARIEHRATGIVHLDATAREHAGYRRLLEVIGPAGIRVARQGSSQTSPPPIIEPHASGITLIYPELMAGDERTGIEARVTIDLVEEHDEARFTVTLVNHGDEPLTEVHFPVIGGWQGVGGPGRDQMIVGGNVAHDPHGFPIPKGIPFLRARQRQMEILSVSSYTPWIDLSGPGGGIAYLNYMPRPLAGGAYIENLAGYEEGLYLAYGWAFQPLIPPCGSWTSPTVGISVHDGDWHETADKYNRWVATWYQPAPTPLSAKLSIGYQNVMLRAFDGQPHHSIDSIPALARVGRTYGVNHLAIWDYLISGNYGRADNHDLLDYSAEEKESLRRALLQAKEEGTNVSALINFRLANSRSSVYDEKEAVRNLDGSPRVEQWSGSSYHYTFWTPHLGPVCHVLSPRSEQWRQRVYRQTEEYLALGFTSMFYDQPFQFHPDYSVQEHGAPDESPAACQDVIAEVRRLLARNNPESYLIGEQCSVHASQYIDIWMSWYMSFPPVERTCYAIPYTINSYPVDGNAWQASKTFALGMQLCLCTCGIEQPLDAKPAFAAHVAQLAALRQTCAERTVLGHFRHTRGLDLDLDDDVCVYAYDSAHGPAVTAAAGANGGRAVIRLNRDAFQAVPGAQQATLFRLDGSQTSLAANDHIEVELAPNEAVVAYL
jgi:hypothetical protein